jgi:hypothetical protein
MAFFKSIAEIANTVGTLIPGTIVPIRIEPPRSNRIIYGVSAIAALCWGLQHAKRRKIDRRAIIAAATLLVWTFGYEIVGVRRLQHQNRLTGAVCQISEECWFR